MLDIRRVILLNHQVPERVVVAHLVTSEIQVLSGNAAAAFLGKALVSLMEGWLPPGVMSFITCTGQANFE